ncbi:MAG: response regulator [Bacteroidia bacterium]|jgi:CheY-like chemotaxis protein|nr:response regulator [Bacteroidia bacterium]
MLKNVLLVDDDDVTLMICKLRLKKSQFCEEVHTADNGEEAIQFFKNQLSLSEVERSIPELIFLDINMPIINGWDFLDEFEKSYSGFFPNVKIKILSSSVDPKDLEKASNHPLIMGFITKPLTDDNLKDLLNSNELKSLQGM